MDFENEPLENEEERELQDTSDGAAEESDSDDRVSEVTSLPADDEVDPIANETEATEEEGAPEAAAAGSGMATVTPASESVFVDVSSGELAPADSAEGGFIELDPSDEPAVEATSSFDEVRPFATGASDLSPHAQSMLNPTSDGGPPLARPLIMVRLADDQMEHLINEICKRMAKRNEQTCRELVQHLINQEFWRRDCQERAIIGSHRR
jgi:hypothetical protein